MKAKYRQLRMDELEALEQEFIEFLTVNGIDAPEWEKLKSTNDEQVDGLINTFSNAVFEKIFSKIHYLQKTDKKVINCYHFEADKVTLVALSGEEIPEADFTDPEYLAAAKNRPPTGLKILRSEKKYLKSREEDIFSLINAGCEISDGKFYQSLTLSLKSTLN